MSDGALVDLHLWPTDRVGEAYVLMLSHARTDDPRLEPVQREWTRRPKSERLEALRLCRERAARHGFDAASAGLDAWADSLSLDGRSQARRDRLAAPLAYPSTIVPVGSQVGSYPQHRRTRPAKLRGLTRGGLLVAHQTRRDMLLMIEADPGTTFTGIAAAIPGSGLSSIRYHLQRLLHGGIVQQRRDGYCLTAAGKRCLLQVQVSEISECRAVLLGLHANASSTLRKLASAATTDVAVAREALDLLAMAGLVVVEQTRGALWARCTPDGRRFRQMVALTHLTASPA